MPRQALMKCHQDSERYPIVILHKNEPVGFFVLHMGNGIRGYTDNARAVLIRALSITRHAQGKGFALQAMKSLPTFVRKHFPTVNEMVLAVNEDNVAAEQLYRKVGFLDSGLKREGPIGAQSVFYLPL
nr:GNAT family N-acetyltransferase [Melghirimyces algeriensis]